MTAMDKHLDWFTADMRSLQDLKEQRLLWAMTVVSLVLEDEVESAQHAAAVAQAINDKISMLLEDTAQMQAVGNE